MSKHYPHLLSPVRLGKHVLKNRLLASNALPHFLQGPEEYPAEPIFAFIRGVAKNGPAIVTFADWTRKNPRSGPGDFVHFPTFDLQNTAVQNYLTQLTDTIHYYGALASYATATHAPEGWGVVDNDNPPPPMEIDPEDGDAGMPPMPPMKPQKAVTEREMQELIDATIADVRRYVDLGFDMVSYHMAYRNPLPAQFLSPITNTRTDEYGGPIENRAKFALAICRATKEAFGPDFPIEVVYSGEEEGGMTLEDSVKFAKMAEGLIDILQIRAGTADLSHPTGFNSVKGQPVTLRVSEAIKASGARVLTAPVGGFQDPEEMERFLAQGKADLIAAGRAYICDTDFYEKLLEGRGDDVTPCIRCNCCHGLSMNGPWLSACSVNPVIGIQHQLDQLVKAPGRPKRVAVIGGGPAGMNAALLCARRGHTVDLYEAAPVLGGQLFHADYSSFKWPLRDLKDHLIHEVEKYGVTVHLNTRATPAMIAEGGYDAVISALGAEAQLPPIPGLLDEKGQPRANVLRCIDVYGHEDSVGQDVVLIGGSETGMETAIHLAQAGKNVTVLTRQKTLAPAAQRVHYYSIFRDAWRSQPNLTAIRSAVTTGVEDGAVTWREESGACHTLAADTVVVSGGVASRSDEAMAFAGCAQEFYMIGDCREPGNVRSSMRSSFAAASQI